MPTADCAPKNLKQSTPSLVDYGVPNVRHRAALRSCEFLETCASRRHFWFLENGSHHSSSCLVLFQIWRKLDERGRDTLHAYFTRRYRERRSPNIISANIVSVMGSPCFRVRASVCSNRIDAYVVPLCSLEFLSRNRTLVNKAENSWRRSKETVRVR